MGWVATPDKGRYPGTTSLICIKFIKHLCKGSLLDTNPSFLTA